MNAMAQGDETADSPRWKREQLGEYTSNPNETLEQFMKRVSPALHIFTLRTGNEACAAIGMKDGTYAIRLYTDGVPHGCTLQTTDLLDGYTFTGETIHSHPWQKILVMTPAASAWSEFYKDGNARTTSLRNDGSSGFSKADRVNGDGWLVAGGNLLHLSNGKTQKIGSIKSF